MKKSTPNCMVYGESGRYPLNVSINCRILSYWCKLLNDNENKLSSIIYRLSYYNYVINDFKFAWIKHINDILNNCGFSNIFHLQNGAFNKWLVSSVKLGLVDQFRQSWHENIENSPKCINYKIFKYDLVFEKYFDILDDRDIYTLCKFRTLNHCLPIEQGRWLNIERGERICTFCDKNDLGDEYHYIMECPRFADDKTTFLPKNIYYRPNVMKFSSLFTINRISVLKKLCKFIRVINQIVSPPG